MSSGCEHRWELIGLTWCSKDYQCHRCGQRFRREAQWLREDGLKRLLWPPMPA